MWDPAKFHGGEAAASRKYDRDNPGRYKGAPTPKRFTTTDKPPDTTAASKKAHAESDRRMVYNKPVRAKTERTARG